MKKPRFTLSRGWTLFILAAMIAGFALRLLFVDDMEYKEDEQFDFLQSQPGTAWSWIGMPSGVYVPNPGMSVWVFKALAWIARAHTPTQLAHAVQLFALLGICALLPFILRALRPGENREPWLWAMAIAFVDPFAVFYQRKLWPEPVLLPFSLAMLAGWWRRDLWLGAFVWGFVGAWLGQIHMSGFFYAFALFACTLLFSSQAVARARVHWRAWIAGSIVGALPLIPWAAHVVLHPVHETISHGWGEALQLKFWVFWATDPLGLHLGNPLGLLRGPSNWDQLSDFVRYPLIAGRATYLNGLAHAVAVVASAGILLPALWRGVQRAWNWKKPQPDLRLALVAGVWGFGLLLTASSIIIRRYYLMVSFPLEFVWLTSLALQNPRLGRRWLATLWACQLFISACFVGYVHVNEGSRWGDYGDAYHVVIRHQQQ